MTKTYRNTEALEVLARRRAVREDLAALRELGMSEREAFAVVRSCDEVSRWNGRAV